MATKPDRPISLRAFLKASVHFLMLAKAFLPAEWAFFVTILPLLLLMRSLFLWPLAVLSLEPAKTTALMCLPRAILEMPLAFMTFIALVFIAAGRAMMSRIRQVSEEAGGVTEH